MVLRLRIALECAHGRELAEFPSDLKSRLVDFEMVGAQDSNPDLCV
jgi:hypothetical protein